MKKIVTQMGKFGIVGVICFVIDYGLLIFGTEVLHLYYLLSAALAFSGSVIINYLLSMRFVFQSKQIRNKTQEFALFVLLSVIGLAINEISMAAFVERFVMHYLAAKIIATGIVMVYNFVTRKLLLESRPKRQIEI